MEKKLLVIHFVHISLFGNQLWVLFKDVHLKINCM